MNDSHLTEGLTSEEQIELDDLGIYLSQYDAPEVDTAALMDTLRPFMSVSGGIDKSSSFIGLYGWLKLARMQFTLVSSRTWWASLLLIVVGLLVLSASYDIAAVLFVLFSPVLVVLGMACIFRPEARSLRELELLSMIDPLEMLYARLILLLVVNVVPTFSLLLVAWSQDSQIVLWRLLLVWFGPMIGMMGLALYTTLRWNALVGAIAPLVLWGILLGLGWREALLTSHDLWNGLMQVILFSDWMLFVALSALTLGLLLIISSGRFVRRQSYFAAY